jgi:hypothetical protein
MNKERTTTPHNALFVRSFISGNQFATAYFLSSEAA